MNSSNCHWVIPQKLYKYYSINENLYKVIKSGSCWFSRPLDFNDPFDCNLDVSIGNSDEEIINNIEKSSMLRLLKEELSNRSSEVKGAGERFAMHQQAICTKSILWKYEKEWRVITDDGCGLKKFDKQDITRVIFGANISDNDKKRILSLLKANEYTAIKYCQCQLSEHKYSLEICDI